MQRLTKEQSAVLSAYTGVLCGDFSSFHEYVERIMGRPVFTHEMGFTHEMVNEKVADEIKQKSRKDFLALVSQ